MINTSLDAQSKSRLVKLLEMTRSDYDGEILAAIRKANELIKTAGESWTTLLNPAVIHYAPHTSYKSHPKAKPDSAARSEKINEMLDYCLSVLDDSSSIYAFIDSLAKYFEDNARLTDKQYASLTKIYNRHKNRKQ